MSDNRITSIEIYTYSNGLHSMEDIVAEKVSVYRAGSVKHKLFNGYSNIAIKEYQYKVGKQEIEEFFEFLVFKVKIQEWKVDYSVMVCDGWGWSFKIRYSNNKVTKILGTVESPPRSGMLNKLIKGLVKFEEDPWMF